MKKENPLYCSGLIGTTPNQLSFPLLASQPCVVFIHPVPVSHTDNPFRMSRKKEHPARERGRAHSYSHNARQLIRGKYLRAILSE